jgi:pimeloyl-ACP methyl ester carboxylesterase
MTRQRVVKFGSVTPLTGVLTEPPAAATPQDTPVLLLNSGILHHVGANRIHVQIARRLAELGFRSLRFDFSGIGDSEARRDELSFEQSAPLETKDAMDYLSKSYNAQRVVLMGLCSGADVAHLTAVADPRVAGLGLIDPWAYRTPGFYFHYYWERVKTPAVYANWIKVRLERIKDRLSPRPTDDQDPDMYEMPRYIREFPPRETIAKDLRGFMSRNLQLYFIFSGGMGDVYNHRSQYRASFKDVDFGDRLRVDYVRDASHVFSGLEHQEFLARELSTWTAAKFSSSKSDRAPITARTA